MTAGPVLVVEDDPLIAWAIEAAVRDMGLDEVIVASTGESAMAAAATARFALIVCDLNLGPLTVDGLQLLALIDPEETVPTLVYTAYCGPEIEAAIRERRPRARCVTKPAPDRQLAAAIRELLGLAEPVAPAQAAAARRPASPGRDSSGQGERAQRTG